MLDLPTFDLAHFEPAEDDPASGADKRTVLYASMSLGGYPMHVWAVAVITHPTEADRAENPDYEDDLATAYALFGGASGSFGTVDHEGRSYALVAIPHS